MGVRAFLRALVGDAAQVQGLTDSATVSRLVPAEAHYVTAGPVTVVRDATAFNGGPPGKGPYGRPLSAVPAELAERQGIGLLVLAEERLRVLTEHGELWSAATAEVVALDAHRRAGFLLFLRDGGGLAVGPQTPVRVPPGARFRTAPPVTNAVSGWDEALAPHGTPCIW